MSTSQQILDNAQNHLSLLKARDDLQYAPSALAQQTSYLKDLQTELKNVKANVAKLANITTKERKEHELLRDSTTRRLAHKLAGKKEKFEAKREKEEREYVEALEKEMRERGNETMLENMIAEAKRVKSDLEEKSTRLGLVKAEISQLYHLVFDGPTEEFPRDDQLERQLADSQQTYNVVQAQLNTHSQAVNLLQQADKMLIMALQSMDEALGYSTWDVYGGGTLSDMMERSALSNAAMHAAKAEVLMQQARRTSSDVQTIGQLRVHNISMFGDVFFDNIFSDIRAHQKMQSNRAELASAHGRLQNELRSARRRAQSAGADLLEISEVLSGCHEELDTFRKDTFLRISGRASAAAGSGSTEELPGYGETSTTAHVSAETVAQTAAQLARANSPAMTPPPPFGGYTPPPGPTPDHSPVRPSMPMPEPSTPRASGSTSPRRSPMTIDKALPLVPQELSDHRGPSPVMQPQQRYAPPPGPPPGMSNRSDEISVSHSPPAINVQNPSNSSLQSARPDSSLNHDIVSTPTPSLAVNKPRAESPNYSGESDGSPSSPSHIPRHWGTKNPFAAMMMRSK